MHRQLVSFTKGNLKSHIGNVPRPQYIEMYRKLAETVNGLEGVEGLRVWVIGRIGELERLGECGRWLWPGIPRSGAGWGRGSPGAFCYVCCLCQLIFI